MERHDLSIMRYVYALHMWAMEHRVTILSSALACLAVTGDGLTLGCFNDGRDGNIELSPVLVFIQALCHEDVLGEWRYSNTNSKPRH